MKSIPTTLGTALLAAALLVPMSANAHCDGLDGPVVPLAQEALDAGDVNLVLPWVPAVNEPEIRGAFNHAAAVRKLGPDAKRLADTYFFETLVRVHRAGEGAPYAGLKPAGRDLGPAVHAADEALATGSLAAVEQLLTEAVQSGLHQHFEVANRRVRYDRNDVAAGRRYVEAYVPYVHYVERIWEATANPPPHHDHEADAHKH
jgi:hypothetical protein